MENWECNNGMRLAGFDIQGVTTEFLEGELNWSTFEAGEAKSKLSFFARVSSVPATR